MRDYKITPDGVFIHLTDGLFDGWEQVTKADDIIGFAGDDLEADTPVEGIHWIGEKIPMSVMAPVIGTIRAFPIMETGYQLYYSNSKGEWRIKCPLQYGCRASVVFENTGVPIKGTDFFPLGTIHTHPNMEAFWSGADMASNARRFGIHMVFGLHNGIIDTRKITLFTPRKHWDIDSEIFDDDVDLLADCKPNLEWVKCIEAQFKPGFELEVDGEVYRRHKRPEERKLC